MRGPEKGRGRREQRLHRDRGNRKQGIVGGICRGNPDFMPLIKAERAPQI